MRFKKHSSYPSLKFFAKLSFKKAEKDQKGLQTLGAAMLPKAHRSRGAWKFFAKLSFKKAEKRIS